MTSSFFTLGNAIRGTILFGLFIGLFVLVQSCEGPKGPFDAYATGELKGLMTAEAPPRQPSSEFKTADGQVMTFADYEDKITLVNIWATWCPPCIKEMPSLDRLQALRGNNDFQVITISVDRTVYEPAKFFVDNNIDNLAPWHDGSFGIPGNLDIRGFPTTVFYGPAGNELARFEGDAEWDSEEALRFVDYLTSTYLN